MRIYFAHPTSIGYQELYATIRADEDLARHEVILPHESPDHENNPRDFYKTLDLVIAEVSAPSTGLGIELGWAHDDGVPVYAFHRTGTTPSSSIYSVIDHIATYSAPAELTSRIKDIYVGP